MSSTASSRSHLPSVRTSSAAFFLQAGVSFPVSRYSSWPDAVDAIRASFLVIRSMWWQRVSCLEGAPCSAITIMNFFMVLKQEAPHFHFALYLANDAIMSCPGSDHISLLPLLTSGPGHHCLYLRAKPFKCSLQMSLLQLTVESPPTARQSLLSPYPDGVTPLLTPPLGDQLIRVKARVMASASQVHPVRAHSSPFPQPSSSLLSHSRRTAAVPQAHEDSSAQALALFTNPPPQGTTGLLHLPPSSVFTQKAQWGLPQPRSLKY